MENFDDQLKVALGRAQDVKLAEQNRRKEIANKIGELGRHLEQRMVRLRAAGRFDLAIDQNASVHVYTIHEYKAAGTPREQSKIDRSFVLKIDAERGELECIALDEKDAADYGPPRDVMQLTPTSIDELLLAWVSRSAQ